MINRYTCIAIAAITCSLHAADTMITTDQLDDVLAKVNGKPIRKVDVFPRPIPLEVSLERAIKPRIAKYIDQMLAVQAAEAEGLDKTDAFRKGMEAVERKAELIEIAALARYYESKLPAIAAARDHSNVADADAAAYVEKHPERFRGKSRTEAIESARAYAAHDAYIGARIEWMTKNLSNLKIVVDGTAIPETTIAEAIDAADARYWTPTAMLLEAVVKMVVAREAEASGDNRKDILVDADRVRNLVAAAQFEIGDQTVTLGKSQRVGNILPMMKPNEIRTLRPVVLELVRNVVMAKKARAEGLHKDAEFEKQTEQTAIFVARSRSDLLSHLYQDKHLEDGSDADSVVATLRDNARIEYLLD